MFGSGLAQDSTKGEGEAKFSAEEARLALAAAQEGVVLLENDGALPLRGSVAVFGRCQVNSFYVGYGSGGDVKAPYKVSILQGLEEAQGEYAVDKDLAQTYRNWCKKNVPNEGFWGHWPMNYPEMPLSAEAVREAAKRNSTALVIIGRAAGEDRENTLEKGSYYLTDTELDMLSKVTSAFKKTAVVLNCGNVIDLSWTEKYKGKISALVYGWQGGMETGHALANILSGKSSPCGKLPVTIAKSYSDYPSSSNFGNKDFNFYKEDIFVGYRYFSTFANDRALYSFGYGLSYTQFAITAGEFKEEGGAAVCPFKVKNVGNVSGKEVVQLYVSAPQGKLGKAALSLVGFYKTGELKAGEEVEGEIRVNIADLASYDDSGATGNKHCYVLEEGVYTFLIGNSSADVKKAGEHVQPALHGAQRRRREGVSRRGDRASVEVRVVEGVAADDVRGEIPVAGPEGQAVDIAPQLRGVIDPLRPDEGDVDPVGNAPVARSEESHERIRALAHRGANALESVDDQHLAPRLRGRIHGEGLAREALAPGIHGRHAVAVDVSRTLVDLQLRAVDITTLVEASVVDTRVDHVSARCGGGFERVGHGAPRQGDTAFGGETRGKGLHGKRLNRHFR